MLGAAHAATSFRVVRAHGRVCWAAGVPACTPTHARGHPTNLVVPCRQLLKEIIDKKENMGDIMKGAFFSWTEAVYSAGDGVKHTIFDNVESATFKVTGGLDNVAGVKIPKFHSFVQPGDTKMELTGASGAGFGIQPQPMAPVDGDCARLCAGGLGHLH